MANNMNARKAIQSYITRMVDLPDMKVLLLDEETVRSCSVPYLVVLNMVCERTDANCQYGVLADRDSPEGSVPC